MMIAFRFDFDTFDFLLRLHVTTGERGRSVAEGNDQQGGKN